MKYLLPSFILLFMSAARLGAQGICDSIISIAPIQPVCQGTGEHYLQVSHPGGVFSGPGLTNGTAYLNAQFVPAGTHTATYTIIGPGGCSVSTTRQFEVLAAEEAFTMVSGTIDCADPNSEVEITAFPPTGNYFGETWAGPPGSGIVAHDNVITTDYAGLYTYSAYTSAPNLCPAFAFANVAFSNNTQVFNLVSCTDCDEWNGFPPLRVKVDPLPVGWTATLKAPNGATITNATACIGISSFFPSGLWTVEVKNALNGCRSVTSAQLNTENARPNVSSGSDLSLPCGSSGYFIASMAPANANGFNYFWTKPNSSTEPASYGMFVDVDEPGMYILHGINTFTGCEDRDTSFAFAAPTPLSTQISVICDGDSLNGHTQTGTYTDTISLPDGCIKIQITKLIVLAPLLDEVVVEPDNGQMTGSIQYTVTQGWPPFVYIWSNGETDASISNLSAGTYTITVTDTNDCQHVREIEVPLNKPLRRLSAERASPMILKTRLYPNPVSAGLVQFTFEINSNEAGYASLLLQDVLGRNISTRDIQIQEGANTFSMEEQLPEGVYAVFLKGDFGTREVSKLVVVGRK